MSNLRYLFALLAITSLFQISAQEKVVKFSKGHEKVTNTIDQYNFNAQDAYFEGYFFRFITLESVPNQEKLTKFSQNGIQLLEYVPDNTYLAAIPSNISKDNLDLIAWYLFIRSCHRNFESYGISKISFSLPADKRELSTALSKSFLMLILLYSKIKLLVLLLP